MKNPTPRQQKAAKAVVENLLKDQPLPTGQVLENIGYSKGITETPQMVLGSEGFKNALSQIGLKEALIKQGINPEKIAEKINILLEATDDSKPDYTAIDKGLKHATAIYGITDAPKPSQANTYNFIFNPEVQKGVREIEEKIKTLLIKQRAQKD